MGSPSEKKEDRFLKTIARRLREGKGKSLWQTRKDILKEETKRPE
jgi:hypothetical protein